MSFDRGFSELGFRSFDFVYTLVMQNANDVIVLVSIFLYCGKAVFGDA